MVLKAVYNCLISFKVYWQNMLLAMNKHKYIMLWRIYNNKKHTHRHTKKEKKDINMDKDI